MLSQATGGESFVDGLKELVSNADTGTINRSIGMLQSHRRGVTDQGLTGPKSVVPSRCLLSLGAWMMVRTGADQATLQIMTDGGVEAAAWHHRPVE